MALLPVMQRRYGSHAMWQTNERVCRTIRLRSAGGPPGPDGRSMVVRPPELPPYLGIRFLVSNIDIYLLIVTALVTFRNTVPKRAFCRVLAFFSGLCLGCDRGDGNGEETISRLQHLGKPALLEGPQCRRWSCRLWRRSARQAWLEGGPEGRALRQVRGS